MQRRLVLFWVGGWVVWVGREGAYPDPVVTSCHVRVATGLVALLLRIGAWSGVKHPGRMAYLVCLRYGARSVRMRTVSSDANVGLCSAYICVDVCAST